MEPMTDVNSMPRTRSATNRIQRVTFVLQHRSKLATCTYRCHVSCGYTGFAGGTGL
jgi:hypothetical protein